MLEGACGPTRIAYGFVVSATIADYSFAFGRVPKWSKGTDCKSVIRGFESHLGLFGPVGVSGRADGGCGLWLCSFSTVRNGPTAGRLVSRATQRRLLRPL